MKYTGIIILQYNNWTDTVNCIKSIQQYNTAPIKLIIVDNGSRDKQAIQGLTCFLKEEFHEDLLVTDDSSVCSRTQTLPGTTFLCSQTNDGYARGNNKGLQLAFNDPDIDYTLILNNDTLLIEDIIPQLRNDVDKHPECAFITPLLYKKDLISIDRNCARHQPSVWYLIFGNLLVFRIPDFLKNRYYINFKSNTGIHLANLISGSCMFSRKSAMEKLQGYDPNTFLYYEENILWEKARKLGLINMVDTDCHCVHLGGATISKRPSLNIIKIMFESQTYFVHNFTKKSHLQCALLRLSQKWVISLLSIKRKLSSFRAR